MLEHEITDEMEDASELEPSLATQEGPWTYEMVWQWYSTTTSKFAFWI